LLAGGTRPLRCLANDCALLLNGSKDRVFIYLRTALLAQMGHRQAVLVQRDARSPLPAA
jgi:hypothetical protein